MSEQTAGSPAAPIVAGATNPTPGSVKVGTTERLGGPWVVTDELHSFMGIWENGVANGKNFANQMVTDGFILTVYYDSRHLPTVGCGHLVVAADKLKIGDKITKARAEELHTKDIKAAEDRVNKAIMVPLFQYEYDALVSVTFNAGVNGAAKLLAEVNKGDYKKIPAFITTFRTGGGNTKRRASEAQVFKSGVYDASH